MKIGTYGILSWLIPFATGFLFYSRQGELQIDVFFFKSIMIVEGALVGTWLLVKLFKNIKSDYVIEGAKIGLLWFAINLILDVVVLLPMSKMPFTVYFMQIGMRYFIIPIISIGLGKVLEQSRQNN